MLMSLGCGRSMRFFDNCIHSISKFAMYAHVIPFHIGIQLTISLSRNTRWHTDSQTRAQAQRINFCVNLCVHMLIATLNLIAGRRNSFTLQNLNWKSWRGEGVCMLHAFAIWDFAFAPKKRLTHRERNFGKESIYHSTCSSISQL